MVQEITENGRKGIVGGLVDTFRHALDAKKRLTIPSEWRDAMGMDPADKSVTDYVYVFPDAVEDCLDLVPAREMQKILDDLSSRDILEHDADAIALAQSAQMLKVDSVGRIRIGDELLEFAGVKVDVVLVGAFRKAQIWAAEKKSAPGKLDVAAFRAALARRREAARS